MSKAEPLDFDAIEALEESKPFKFEEPGDTIAGFITNIGTRNSTYGTFTFIQIETRNDGIRDVPIFTGQLTKKIAELPLEIGDGLKITYLGFDELNKDGKRTPFKTWSVGHKPMHRQQAVAENPLEPLREKLIGTAPSMPEPVSSPSSMTPF